MRGAIEYYSRIAAPGYDASFCWLLTATERGLSRVRVGGRFLNAPRTKQQEVIVAHIGDRVPILMLFRQKGEAAKGWRDAPFWWPVFLRLRNWLLLYFQPRSRMRSSRTTMRMTTANEACGEGIETNSRQNLCWDRAG